MAVKQHLADIWSATDFRSEALGGYAVEELRADVRRGVRVLAALSLAMQLVSAAVEWYAGAGYSYLYTNLILAALSAHILVSAKLVDDVGALQGLGMVLLLVTALAITFLAHRNGSLTTGMMSAVVMLFIAIPLVPWALREAVIVIGLTYGLLTASLISVPGRFDWNSLLSLQVLVAGTAVVVLTVIARNTSIRKHDIRTRFELESARQEMELLSMKDHLTGAWNRRFLDSQFPQFIDGCREHDKTLNVAIFDIDDFKGINDEFGHHVGDEILRNIADIFIQLLGNRGCLIRLGGDEFQIFYCGGDLQGLIGRAVARLHETPVARELDKQRTVTVSAGFTSTGFDDAIDLADLYRAADAALYEAKQNRTERTDVGEHTGTWKL